MTPAPKQAQPIELPEYMPPNMNPGDGPSVPIRLETVVGFFTEVNTTPTWIPKTFQQSMAINSTAGIVYYYDFINNVWRNTAGSGTAFGGSVGASASGNTLPTGWSAAYNSSTKVYTVTHNLGNSSYAVVAIPIGVYSSYAFVNSIVPGTNSFSVEFVNSSGTGGNPAWMFTLVLIS